MEEQLKINCIKVRQFKDLQKAIHLKKKNGIFYNGFVKEISRYYFILDEFKLGNTLVIFEEIEGEIREFREVKK